jgi:hypothetical protein
LAARGGGGKAAAGAGVAGMIDPSEGRFLTYIARRIDHEVARCQRREQSAVQARVNIDRLATCALEVLGSKDELEAWLEAATSEPALPRLPSSS